MTCERAERVPEYALRALTPEDTVAFEAHLEACPECRCELDALRPVVDRLVDWSVDIARPASSLWSRVARRIADESGTEPRLVEARWPEEPAWKEVAPGITCKLLATDPVSERVTALVRLAPGVAYPPHRHAAVEELHLLDGELWIDDRLLRAGDYSRAEPSTSDDHVWSETGCTCVLVTSFGDELI